MGKRGSRHSTTGNFFLVKYISATSRQKLFHPTDLFQWCPMTGQETAGTNRNTGRSLWTSVNISLLWQWLTEDRLFQHAVESPSLDIFRKILYMVLGQLGLGDSVWVVWLDKMTSRPLSLNHSVFLFCCKKNNKSTDQSIKCNSKAVIFLETVFLCLFSAWCYLTHQVAFKHWLPLNSLVLKKGGKRLCSK